MKYLFSFKTPGIEDWVEFSEAVHEELEKRGIRVDEVYFDYAESVNGVPVNAYVEVVGEYLLVYRGEGEGGPRVDVFLLRGGDV